MAKKVDPTVAEPLLRFAITSLTNADDRLSNLPATEHDPRVAAAQHHIDEAIRHTRAWAEAHGIAVRSSMLT